MNLREIGSLAEAAACTYLEERGWEILDRNVRLGRGELDIVARRDGIIAFIEVKHRRNLRFGTPGEAVTPAKRRSIIGAAMLYAAKHSLMDEKLRFDVIERMEGEFRHIEGAFDATDFTF